MKTNLKMYFLASGSDVFAGPYFTVDQACQAIKDLHPPLQAIVRVVKISGTFPIEEV